MAFLGGLFKKKPGGTFFGNLLRTVSSTATGGILGSGANKVELGQTQTNAQLAQGIYDGANQTAPNPTLQAIGQLAGQNPDVQQGVAKTLWQKYKFVIIAAVLVVGGLAYKAFNKKKKFGR